jgi:hypothetical protein
MNASGKLDSILLNDSVEFADGQGDSDKSYSQYINDNYHCSLADDAKLHVTLDNHYFDFGSLVVTGETDETAQKTLNVFNHTKGKLLICWNTSKCLDFFEAKFGLSRSSKRRFDLLALLDRKTAHEILGFSF